MVTTVATDFVSDNAKMRVSSVRTMSLRRLFISSSDNNVKFEAVTCLSKFSYLIFSTTSVVPYLNHSSGISQTVGNTNNLKYLSNPFHGVIIKAIDVFHQIWKVPEELQTGNLYDK
jgi:hypothetical protein